MNTDLISILVPVYNVGIWLQGCLDSISGQTWKNLEVILVDDGSTDGSAALCERFVREDPRFRLIRQENKGVSAARNVALEAATGEYVFFLDADDYLHPQALEVLHKAICSGPYDMATGGHRRVEESGQIIGISGTAPRTERSGEDCIKEIFGKETCWMVVWNHLIPRRVIQGLRFEPIAQEDVLFCFFLYRKLKRTIIVDETTYFYVSRPDSLSLNQKYIGDDARNRIYNRMLESLPAGEEQLRAWILTKIYRRFLTSRYHAKNRQEKEKWAASHKPLIRRNRDEYYGSRAIPVREKAMFTFLLLSPWAMWLYMKATHN